MIFCRATLSVGLVLLLIWKVVLMAGLPLGGIILTAAAVYLAGLAIFAGLDE